MKRPISSDLRLLLAATTLRAFATGMGGVLLGIYLAQRGLSLPEIGIVLSAGLGSGLLAMALISVRGDRWGRKRALMVLAVLGAIGGVWLVAADSYIVALAAATLGMANGTGRDRGAATVLEQAILPQFTSDTQRTLTFARYSLLQSLGRAFGGLAAGLPVVLQTRFDLTALASLQAVIFFYALLHIATLLLNARLSPAIEAASRIERQRLAPESRRTLGKLSMLFGIDSIAGGFLASALVSYFFFERFGVSSGQIGVLFFLAGLLNAASHLGAAWLARRIGLVNTMVFTHIPANVILIGVGLAPSFAIAAVLFLMREALVEMDIPTRQSYVMAVVGPEERTLATGITNLVRLGGWAVAPSMAGFLMQGLTLAAPLFVGAAMKIGYDLMLFAAFRRHKAPEEKN
ncbi:MAG: MFS transporter [Nevskiales bacterium]